MHRTLQSKRNLHRACQWLKMHIFWFTSCSFLCAYSLSSIMVSAHTVWVPNRKEVLPWLANQISCSVDTSCWLVESREPSTLNNCSAWLFSSTQAFRANMIREDWHTYHKPLVKTWTRGYERLHRDISSDRGNELHFLHRSSKLR